VGCVAALMLAPAASGGARLAAQDVLRIGLCPARSDAPRDSAAAVTLAADVRGRLALVRRPSLETYGLPTCRTGDAVDVDYVVETELGRASQDSTLLEARLRVLSPEWKLWGGFASRGRNVAELLEGAAPKLVLTLTQPIRIAALRFPQRSGDTIRFGGFSTALPHMLREGLVSSSRIVLVDQDSTARREMEQQFRDSGALDSGTSLQFGRLLGANYLIAGDYLELDGSLWIDVQCVSVETGQVVFSQGVVVDSVTVRAVHRRMSELAEALRSSIAEDFLAQPAGPRYLAVSGFAPYPDTRENRQLLEAIVRTAARKLRAAGDRGIRIQDTPERQEDVVRTGTDRWQISAERDADLLLSFRLDRSQRDSLVLDLDVFDPSRPRDVAATWHLTAPVDDVDLKLNPVLATILESLLPEGSHLLPEERAALDGHPYRGLIQNVGFPVRVGLAYQTARELFLGVTVGIELEGGMSLVLDDRGHWSVGPALSVFLIGLKGAPKVVGLDIMAGGRYHFRPHLTRNIYVGVGLGYFGVTRFGTGATNFDASFGTALSVGFEKTLQTARKISFEVEWHGAFHDIAPKTLAGFLYAGGRPGGLSVSVGTTLH
jgi:hypothetical protein